jgi:hypothetical protein
VGRPGINLLRSPPDPLVREKDLESWHLVNQFRFNGHAEDHFQRTSLHLSFTQYRRAIISGQSGTHESEVYSQEAIVSVHDSGKWIADIDILAAFSCEALERMDKPQTCGHSDMSSISLGMTKRPLSIETWDELLEHSWSETSVVRTSSNQFARLAMVCVIVQLLPSPLPPGSRVIVCPLSTCWACVTSRIDKRMRAAKDTIQENSLSLYIQ